MRFAEIGERDGDGGSVALDEAEIGGGPNRSLFCRKPRSFPQIIILFCRKGNSFLQNIILFCRNQNSFLQNIILFCRSEF